MLPINSAPTKGSSIFPRSNSIGFIRIALAVLVMFTHAHLLGGFGNEWLSGFSGGTVLAGFWAVQAFFVISGVLIAESWVRQPRLDVFVWQRLLRLAPALWGCLIVTAFVFAPIFWLTANIDVDPSTLMRSAVSYVSHNMLVPRSRPAIGSLPSGIPWSGDWNGSLWTLFYESACYLMVAALGLFGLLGRWRRVGIVLIFGSTILFTTVQLIGADKWPMFIRKLFDTPGKQLTVLFLLGVAYSGWHKAASAIARRRWCGFAAAAVMIVCWRTKLYPAFAPWILPPLILWFATQFPIRDFEKRVGGDYSYGLYVYGYPVQQLLAHFGVHAWGFLAYFVSTLCIATVFAIASWHLIEKRALRLKPRAASFVNGLLARERVALAPT